MHGGFFGVEVFFVVSGYLITSLLLDEREQNHRINLGQFWLRRARRLLPALFTMLLAVSLWASLFGTAEQQSTLKRDLPWSIFYLGNWGQILGKAPYFVSTDPPLLRHLWSLAVEEQWYLIWPLVFVGAMAIGTKRLRTRERRLCIGVVRADAVDVRSARLGAVHRHDLGARSSGEPHELHVPQHHHAGERAVARRELCVRVETVAVEPADAEVRHAARSHRRLGVDACSCAS